MNDSLQWLVGPLLLFHRRDNLAPWHSDGECQCAPFLAGPLGSCVMLRKGSVSVMNTSACALFLECWIYPKPYGSRAGSLRYLSELRNHNC